MILVSLFIPIGFFNSLLQIRLDSFVMPIEVIELTYKAIFIKNCNYCCPLKVSEQRDIHPQCCCNGIADDFSEGKPLS